MTRRADLLVALAVALLVGAGSAATSDRPPIIGTWYTEGVEHGNHFQFLMSLASDELFTKNVRQITGCKAREVAMETGRWTFADNILREDTETVGGQRVDTSNPYYHDQFKVREIDQDHAEMRDVKTGITWPLTRQRDFPPLPACNISERL
jgi:hypothetical protein